MRNRVPVRARPSLYLETLYSLGAGAFSSLLFLSPVVIKTLINGTERHMAMFAAMTGGSSLLSPFVSYLGRLVNMRSMVVFPNYLVAVLLALTLVPVASITGGIDSTSTLAFLRSLNRADVFTFLLGAAFIVRVFPRVAEMNMYRVVYPPTHRGSAVGWIKAISHVAGLSATLGGYCWFSFQPDRFAYLYCLIAIALSWSAYCYSKIPFHRNNVFRQKNSISPLRAFVEGTRLFLNDRRFVVYQFGFALAGFANHMSLIYVAEILTEDVIGDRPVEQLVSGWMLPLINYFDLSRKTVVVLIVGFICAVMHALLMMASAPLWGRYLDKINPMRARAIFNTFQAAAYCLYGYGGITLQIWPFALGAALHAIGNGGGIINWLTGSLYFATPNRISLYNAIHVGLTGIRGMVAPLCGLYLISETGPNMGPYLFILAAALSVLGGAVMLVQGMFDPGPREARYRDRTVS